MPLSAHGSPSQGKHGARLLIDKKEDKEIIGLAGISEELWIGKGG
jgi:hypothetical protein